MDDAADLAQLGRGTVVAAAGCGKTDLIARAAAYLDTRQLILTHTNSGVEALRRRLRRVGVPNDRVGVDTLDGWCLKYVSSYPGLSGGVPTDSEDFIDWGGLRQAMLRLLDTALAKRVLAASYAGVLVDEYQDCDYDQHALVSKLAELLPTRILGDPLQAVFRFRGEPPDWVRSVEAYFPRAFSLATPWRWRKPGASPDLGEWLAEVRQAMERGDDVRLRDPRISFVELDAGNSWQEPARNACFAAADRAGTVVAICKWPGDCHTIGRMTGGLFQCVEPIDAKDAGRMLQRLQDVAAGNRPEVLLRFLDAIASNTADALDAVRRALASAPRRHEALDEIAKAVDRLRLVAEGGGAGVMALALESLAAIPGTRIFRRELLWAATDALRDAGEYAGLSFRDALRRRRNLTSHIGRRLARCSVGSTLLVKGMEFDHAIVVHSGGPKGFTVNDLYVALTRGSGSLTVLSAAHTVSLGDLASS